MSHSPRTEDHDQPSPTDVDPEDLLSIGQISERTGVARSALHFYESQGLLTAHRTAGNQRRYPRHLIRRITLISVGRNLGIPLADIRAALESVPMDHRPSEADWQRASNEWRRVLERRRQAIEELETRLTGCIGCGCLSMDACQLANPRDQLSHAGSGAQGLHSPI
ncbi:redox-sensitive transcriptional activator SoxR [Glutamicibacter endophyticus]|uniref:redox-sensitive transcriptional activator SoxR n=1 Tax=Glutamicibacter endophyticus TaxID=1522174 RepID=UPI003AEFD741